MLLSGLELRVELSAVCKESFDRKCSCSQAQLKGFIQLRLCTCPRKQKKHFVKTKKKNVE